MVHLLLAAIYLAFVGLGLPDGLLGAAWPAMRADAAFRGFGGGTPPLSHSGIVFAIIAVCTVVSALQSDRTTRRFGAGRVTAFSTALAAVALFGFSQCRSMAGLCAWAVPYGLAAGAIDAALNNYVALHFASRHMSWLHCMWGVGATAGPYVMGAALTRGAPWQRGYLLVGVAQVLVAAAVFASLPLWRRAAGRAPDAAADAARPPVRLPDVFRMRGAKEILLCFFCYCAIEQTAGLWSATFLAHCGVDPERAAFYAGMVYLGITAGRAVGGFATFRWNDDQMLRIGEGIVLLGLLAVGAAALLPALPPGLACAGFVVVGFGCAPVYPSIIHSTPTHFGADKSQAIIGVQMAFAYLGTTCMPPLFGVLARHVTPALLPLDLLALLVLMSLLYERVVRVTAPRRFRAPLSAGDLSALAGVFRAGGVVIVPTDTVYGVAAAPERTDALARIVAAKGRDPRKPCQLLAASAEAAEAAGIPVPPRARPLARAFWPGALTIVLDVPGGGTEGVRVPDHGVARALCRAAGGLLRCTSANRSGEPPARTAAEAVAALPSADAVVDAGPAPGGVASSVVRFAPDGTLEILREGGIPRAALEAALPVASAT